MKKHKVVLLGKGTLAIRIGKWFLERPNNYEIASVVPVIPEPAWTDSFLTWAIDNQLPVVNSGHFKDIPDVKSENWRTNIALSVFYDKIIKAWFIRRCDRILNLHNGPLPKYRGVSPINWALKNNEKLHGVTIHEITPGIDDGRIVAQLLYSIYPEFDEVKDVYSRALEYGWLLFKETMPLLERIRPMPQEDSQATYYCSQQNNLLFERKGFTKQESLNHIVLGTEQTLQEYADRLLQHKEQ